MVRGRRDPLDASGAGLFLIIIFRIGNFLIKGKKSPA